MAWGPSSFGEGGRRRRKGGLLAGGQDTFFLSLCLGSVYVVLFLSFSRSLFLLVSLPIAISHRFRGRNKFINKRAGDPRQLQGAPAEIERLENNPPSETRRGAARRETNRFPIFFIHRWYRSFPLSPPLLDRLYYELDDVKKCVCVRKRERILFRGDR